MRTFYDEISKIAGNVVTVKAQGIGYDELAVIASSHGSSLAQVIRLEDDQVSLQIFGGTEGTSNADKIRFLGHSFQVPFSDSLLGRVFDGSCRPRDDRPDVKAENVDVVQFSGPHPAGLPSTHIHFVSAVNIHKFVWHLDYQHMLILNYQRCLSLNYLQLRSPQSGFFVQP